MTDATPAVRSCHSCRYFERDTLAAIFGFGGAKDLYAKCYAPAAMHIDPVSGKSEPSIARVERSYDIACGESGKNWEPRK